MNLPAICAAIAFAVGAGAAYSITASHYDAKAAEQQQASAEAYQARTVELNTIAAQLEQARHDRKTVYRTITQQVEKVVARDVYRNDCFDDGGLSIANAALAGRADPAEPVATVPATPAAGR